MAAKQAEIFFSETTALKDAELKTKVGLTASAKAVPGNTNAVKLGVRLTDVVWDADSLFDLADFIEDVAVNLRKQQKRQAT